MMIKKCVSIQRGIIALCLILSCSLCCNWSVGQEKTSNLKLKQPSFEVARKNGAPEDWSGDSTYYSIVSENARTGNACLKWSCQDGKIYRLCSQKTKLTAGDTVEFSVWARTENLKNGKAALCMEWSDSQGRWLGGQYAHGLGGTNREWTKIKARAVIPDNAASVSITCYVTSGGTGTAWFDDVEITSYIPPFFSAITTDHYRHQTIGDTVRVWVGINPLPKKYQGKELTSQLTVLDKNGKKVSSCPPKTIEPDAISFVLDTKSLACGQYKLSVEVKNPISGAMESTTLPLTRLEQFPERKSYIDAHRRLILDGKPFFPLGLYFGGVSDVDLKVIADSPFNCIMPYHPISREVLNKLDKNGKKVIYSVKDNYEGLAVKTNEDGINQTRKKVADLKDHPAIMAWYINDELPLTMLKELSGRRDLMEEWDPGRPTWVVLYQVNEIRSYVSTFDVVGTDPYPIPSKGAGEAGVWSEKTNKAVFNSHAVWQVPQIFDWAAYRSESKDSNKYRPPTYEEVRGMTWMNIAGGANGLVFYSFFDLRKMDKKGEPFEQRWSEVVRMGKEVSEWFPVLLSVDKPLEIKPTSESSPEVMMRLYGQGKDTWLLCVNKSEKPQTTIFQIPTSSKLMETKLGKAAVVQGQKVKVELGPFEPRMIRFR